MQIQSLHFHSTGHIDKSIVESIPMGSTLMAYNASVEINQLKYLANKCPKYKDHLLDLTNNFVDLLEPFRQGYYFDPKKGGSNSIKQVMPALVPSMAEAYH